MKLSTDIKKPRRILSTKVNDIEHMDFFSRYIGKKVFSQSGEKVGVVKDLIFEKGVHKGFLLTKNLFIDKEYFNKEFDEAMMLQIEPVTSIIGKLVFDVDGKKIGKVKDIERTNHGNDYKALLVKKTIFSKPKIIEKKNVDVTKKNVLLKVSVDQVIKKQ
ncbi:MAG: PRC-barrel domain-containing protein [Nanoarchaeota archaeon]|nr:PRC-barrel domain-containing protein [Nanoarchaeota archaeon]